MRVKGYQKLLVIGLAVLSEAEINKDEEDD
jgi:hypothetical protein